VSDQQERTKRLIAEAKVLMEKARGDVRYARDVLARSRYDPEKAQQRFIQAYGAKGPEMFQDLVARQLQAAQMHLENAPPAPEPGPMRSRKLRRMV
jgi:hypothetical protein